MQGEPKRKKRRQLLESILKPDFDLTYCGLISAVPKSGQKSEAIVWHQTRSKTVPPGLNKIDLPPPQILHQSMNYLLVHVAPWSPLYLGSWQHDN